MIAIIKEIFKNLMPQARPVLDLGKALAIAVENNVNINTEICIIGMRGFYGKNKRAIYDDAIFVLTPTGIKCFNANTDPGAYRKGIANLYPGCWLYKLGIHGLSKPKILQYEALVQAADVSVHRDEKGKDTGKFGINIHKGGWSKVSSIGCQTIHPSQWDEFISLVKQQAKKHNQKTIKYILINN